MTLIEILEELGIPYIGSGHRHSSPGWVQICCPNCSDTNFKLGINLGYGTTNCWSCGRASLVNTLAEISGLPWQQIKALLGQFATVGVAQGRIKRTQLRLPSGVGPLLPVHVHYLQQRGYCIDTLVKIWGIRGIGIHPTLAWRVFIPIHFRGKVVSWTTRSLHDTGRRYMAAGADEEAMSAKEILFGEDFCRHAVVVTEGPFDAMRIGPGAVAVMGTSYTESQLAKIAKYPLRVVCFDNEDNAQRRARQMMETLAAVPGQTFNVRLDSKDPGSASEDEILELRRRFLE